MHSLTKTGGGRIRRMDDYENGLGKNRKFGFDKEDGPDKTAIDVDLILKKLEVQLKKKPRKEALMRCQNILDKLANKYEDKCTKKQLSRMYRIQGKIFKYSGEKKLAKSYKYRAQESRKDYGLRRGLAVCFIAVLVIAAIICFFNEQEMQKQRTAASLKKCLEKASIEVYFSGNDEKELSIKCYKENKTDDAEEKIKELQEQINRSQQEKLKEEQKREKDEEYMKQYILEKEKNNIHCSTTYNRYSAYTDCY